MNYVVVMASSGLIAALVYKTLVESGVSDIVAHVIALVSASGMGVACAVIEKVM